jgi:hypothetical protein
MPCSPVNINRCFGRICRLHLQGRRVSQARNQRESRWQAEQSAGRNFGLYRKQEGNGRHKVSSGWLECRTQRRYEESVQVRSPMFLTVAPPLVSRPRLLIQYTRSYLWKKSPGVQRNLGIGDFCSAYGENRIL